MVQMLKDIYSTGILAASLGFKGGTALYLLYSLPRFSVDLDFTFLGSESKDSVYDELGIILARYGTIKERYIKKNTLFFLLSYGDEDRNIKVEVSMRDFGDIYGIKDYMGIGLRVMRKEDMLSHKLCALLDRKEIANRDIFDIWFMLKHAWAVNPALIKARMKMDLKEYLRKCIEAVNKVNNSHILFGLGDLLGPDMKSWARLSLKKDALFLLENYKNKPVVI